MELVKRSIFPLLLAVGQVVCMIITVSLGLFSVTEVKEQKYAPVLDKSIVYQPMFRFCSLKSISDSSFQIFIAALVIMLALFLQLIYKSYKNEMVCEIDLILNTFNPFCPFPAFAKNKEETRKIESKQGTEN